ncbi:MAG: zinc ribbon domain-containing protein [Thermoplasmata archaeon]|nr:zinc ribbon domain-containing protein [Thermoplasmata archaeon]
MTGHDLLGSVVLVVGLMTVAMVGMFLWLRLLRSGYFAQRRKVREDRILEADQAYNAMITSEAISRELQARGFENAHASALVQEARQAYVEGDPDQAEALSSQARTIFQDALAEDRPEHADPLDDEIPETKPVLGKEFPKHYMEAKFLLGVIEGRVKRTKKDSKRGKKARDLWLQAQAAYEDEHYSDALTYAVQCRRLLDGMAPKAPKPRPKCPACGARILKTDDFCGKCGANLQESAGCGACGAPLIEGDRFCRKCGAAMEVPAPVP